MYSMALMTSAGMTSIRALATLVVLVIVSLSGCASSSAPPSRSAARPFDNVRRVAVVVTGESRFTVLEHSAQPGRTLDEVISWTPYRVILKPLAALVHHGINWLLESDRAETAGRDLADISSGSVSTAFAQTLAESGQFQEITEDDVAREVMDAALARAMHDLATDRALVAAFTRVTAAAPPR